MDKFVTNSTQESGRWPLAFTNGTRLTSPTLPLCPLCSSKYCKARYLTFWSFLGNRSSSTTSRPFTIQPPSKYLTRPRQRTFSLWGLYSVLAALVKNMTHSWSRNRLEETRINYVQVWFTMGVGKENLFRKKRGNGGVLLKKVSAILNLKSLVLCLALVDTIILLLYSLVIDCIMFIS